MGSWSSYSWGVLRTQAPLCFLSNILTQGLLLMEATWLLHLQPSITSAFQVWRRESAKEEGQGFPAFLRGESLLQGLLPTTHWTDWMPGPGRAPGKVGSFR